MNSTCNTVPDLRRARPLLGTFVEVWAGGADSQMLQRAVERAFRAVELVQRLMSFHDEASELSRLNRLASTRPVHVHSNTYQVLKTARAMSSATHGLFDVTVAPHLIRWGYLPQRGLGRTEGNWRDLQLLSEHHVAFRRPLCVDLGGIAKGFAVDQAVAELQAAGVRSGGVNAGGDLRMFGEQEQSLYLRSPKNPRQLVPLRGFRHIAVATSAPYFSLTRLRKKARSPLVHPRSAQPFVTPRSVSVFASSCMIADALTKAVLFSTRPPVQLLKRFQARALILQAESEGVMIA